MKSVRADAAAVAGNCNVSRIIPSPSGCLEITAISPGPAHRVRHAGIQPALRKNAHVGSGHAACGTRQHHRISAQRAGIICDRKCPSAATSRSTSSPGTDTPAVVGSTTTMSLPIAVGSPAVNTIASSEIFGVATIIGTAFDLPLSGFCICTLTLPASATSAAVTGAMHSPACCTSWCAPFRQSAAPTPARRRRRKAASNHFQGKARCRSRIHAGRMQRHNVCAGRNRDVGAARLRRILQLLATACNASGFGARLARCKNRQA